MLVAGHSPPPFFKRGPAPLAQLAFFVSLSVVVLVADLRFHTLEWTRLVVATALWPVQRAAHLPVEAAWSLGDRLTSLAALQKENAELKRKQLATANLLLRQEFLDQENKQLRALLDMRDRQPAESRAAEILYSARDPFSRRVIVDKGSQDAVAPGQAVIDDVGVIGQVTRVFPLTSEVTMITDKNQAIPIQVQRNGLRAILAGAGASALELRFLPDNADVQPGDILVTSGLDGVYLPGLPVAKVLKIDRDSSFSFAHISCAPLAGVERHRQVLILGARKIVAPPPTEEAAEPSVKPAKGRKLRRQP